MSSPAARAVVKHVYEYLKGCLDEQAADEWILAVGEGFAKGKSLPDILRRMSEKYREA